MVGADGRDLEGWAPGLGTAAWRVGSRHGLIQRQEAAARQREDGGLRLPHLSTTPVDAFAASTKLLERCVRAAALPLWRTFLFSGEVWQGRCHDCAGDSFA